ncbi:YIP1 family protein [Meridianimarinicoccus roseus]|uniref:YIP1 family protein n=1 Tax=Meridianimarinicoccus roseus TaxID=2072018 RepID=A0A2V2LHS7_9RHOB|nr:YIP1 family protein [Meridianimarinicoccus roseus]PWR03561.1 YIP1 family protein [Meridianimarinicoccus roseus]
MPVTTDIVASYRAPGRVLRRQLAGGVREDRAIAFVMIACLLIFVAQLPRLAREAALDPAAGLAERATGDLFVWLFVMPLAFYGLAALSHLLAKPFRARGSWFDARMALFWALLAAAPLWLLRGLTAGFVGPGTTLDLVTAFALGIFLWLWSFGLREAEWPQHRETRPQGA